MPKNPHNWIERQGCPPKDDWKCMHCGTTGTFAYLEAVACTHVYPPCKYCGETPTCARDCVGIAGALAGDNIHIIGLEIPGNPNN